MDTVDLGGAVESAARTCVNCGISAAADEGFCARCGTSFDGERPGRETATVVLDAPTELVTPPVSIVSPTRRGIRRHARIAAVTAAFVVLIAAAAMLAVLWRGEAGQHQKLARELTASQAQVVSLKSDKRSLQATLDETQALSARRAAVLKRAQRVLEQVTPLLSSVDGLQSLAEKMQTSRDSYFEASSTLKSDLIDLGNYLLDTDSDYINYSYVNDMISQINGEISTVNFYGSELSGYDGDYAKSADSFSTKASAFTNAVQALKQQLAKVGPKETS